MRLSVKLKSHPITENTPALALNGCNVGLRKDCALEREMIGLGAVGYLTKPLDFGVRLHELGKYIAIPQSAQID